MAPEGPGRREQGAGKEEEEEEEQTNPGRVTLLEELYSHGELSATVPCARDACLGSLCCMVIVLFSVADGIKLTGDLSITCCH